MASRLRGGEAGAKRGKKRRCFAVLVTTTSYWDILELSSAEGDMFFKAWKNMAGMQTHIGLRRLLGHATTFSLPLTLVEHLGADGLTLEADSVTVLSGHAKLVPRSCTIEQWLITACTASFFLCEYTHPASDSARRGRARRPGRSSFFSQFLPNLSGLKGKSNAD